MSKEKEMQVIKYSELRSILEKALREAHTETGWLKSGWGIPVYLKDGELSTGGWISSNSWQPGIIEVVRVPGWNVNDHLDGDYWDENPDWTEEDEIESQLDFMIDHLLFRIDSKISEYKLLGLEPEFEIE